MDWFFFQLFFGLPIILPGPDPIDPDPDRAPASPEQANRRTKPDHGSAESQETDG
jgi:hypothetical protein